MCIIETLDQFIKWANQLTSWQYWNRQYLFRGLTRKCYKLEASALRCLLPMDRNITNLRNITRDLIRDARDQGHGEKDGRRLHDLEILAELQHIGAATCLIDFSRSVLVALWMACQKNSKEPQEDGKVCAICSRDSEGTPLFNEISHDLVKEDIGYFLKPNEMGKSLIYQWTPKPQNNRIITQHSVFIFGSSTIDPNFACVIRQEDKQSILRDLELLFNIDEARMFPDLHGFAQRYTHDKHRFPLFPQDYLRRGIRADQRGDFDDAIRCYSNAIELSPADSYSAFSAYNYRGHTHRRRCNWEEAIEDFTKAIELEPDRDQGYNNRGAVYYEQGNWEEAIEDFTRAIKLNPNNDQAYYNRGTTYCKQDNPDKAIEDYTKAIELNPDNDQTYNNRGAVYYEQGNWEEAIADHTKAIELNPDNALAYKNRGEAHQLQGNNDLAEADLRKAEALREQS